MKKETITTPEMQELREDLVLDMEKLRKEEIPWEELAQTLLDQEKTTSEEVESLDEVRESDSQRVDELSEGLIWWAAAQEWEKSEPLSAEQIAERLQCALRYAYDVYLRAKRDGEHCPTVSIGDYVFAARGFTCGRVDYVKVFKEIEKKVLFFFKKKEYVPVEVTMDIVNILAEAGGKLPPLDDETLQKM